MSRRNWILTGLAGAALLAGPAAGVRAQAPAGPAPAPAPAAAPGKPPAVVNGEVVSRAELDAALKQMQPAAVQLTEDQRRAQQMQVLSMLVDNLLMKQFLLKNTTAPAAADVDARVATIAAELAKDKKTVADLLKESGENEAAFRADLALALRWESYAKSKVTEADVAKYYKENKDFFDKVLVRASQIVLRVPPNATEADRLKVRQQLTDLRAQIIANKVDFGEAAKKYSQSPEATNGGDVGYIPRKFVVDENFARAAFSTPVNGVSDVVQTGYGLHLIKVTERKAGEPSDYAKIKDDVREFCVEEMRMSLINELRRSGQVQITLP